MLASAANRSDHSRFTFAAASLLGSLASLNSTVLFASPFAVKPIATMPAAGGAERAVSFVVRAREGLASS